MLPPIASPDGPPGVPEPAERGPKALPSTELAGRLARLRQAMEESRLSRKTPWEVSASIPGLAFSCIAGQGEAYPSGNPNLAEVLEDGSAVTESGIADLLTLCRERGAEKFFFWLDPVPAEANILEILGAVGTTPFRGTSYPVLQRRAASMPLPPTDFRIERLVPGSGELPAGCFGDETARQEFRAYVSVPGWEHFVAYEGEVVVATARLYVHQGLAYLCAGGTLEAYRKRGAQSALIAARVNRAAELGCTDCCVQTLTLLKTSLANLERAGFRLSYNRKVLEWRRA